MTTDTTTTTCGGTTGIAPKTKKNGAGPMSAMPVEEVISVVTPAADFGFRRPSAVVRPKVPKTRDSIKNLLKPYENPTKTLLRLYSNINNTLLQPYPNLIKTAFRPNLSPRALQTEPAPQMVQNTREVNPGGPNLPLQAH